MSDFFKKFFGFFRSNREVISLGIAVADTVAHATVKSDEAKKGLEIGEQVVGAISDAVK
jgi:hypothetical protein